MRVDPRAQAINVATSELTSTFQRAVVELVEAHPDWTSAEVVAVVVGAAARVTGQVARDGLLTADS